MSITLSDMINPVRRILDLDNIDTQAVDWGNRAQHKVASEHHFRELMKWDTSLETIAPYETGTVAVALATPTTVTGDGTTFTSAMVGRYIDLDGAPYKISAYVSATEITLENGFVGTSAITADATKIYPRYYSAPSGCKMIRSILLFDGSDSRKLSTLLPEEFDDSVPHPANLTFDTPHTCINYATRWEPYPIADAAYVVHMRYASWPTAFTAGSSVCDFEQNMLPVLIAACVLEGLDESEGHLSVEKADRLEIKWSARYRDRLRAAIGSDRDQDDAEQVHQGFRAGASSWPSQDYWKYPLRGRTLP